MEKTMQKIKRYIRHTLAIAFLITAISAINAAAATFTVTNTANTGAGSLRQAVLDSNAAAGLDTIVFDSSFNSAQTITLASTLVIDSADNTGTTITGPGAALLTVSDNNAVRVLDIRASETVTISGMTMTQGNGMTGTSPGSGGAIYSNDSTVTLNGVVVSGNSATSEGGGIYFTANRNLTITNSTITNNTGGSFGGGLRISW